ncbi:MAG: hypothetical protein HRT87_09265 [Legionellales bacterium]|nr:hypothetical protein [Legionellales bacterium]
MYVDDFIEAVKFTSELGFKTPQIFYRKDNLELNKLNDIHQIIYDIFSKCQDIEDLAFSCCHYSQQLSDIIMEKTNYKAYLTIGTTIEGGYARFKITTDQIRERTEAIKNDPENNNSKWSYHAWVTLETMEIIDITYFASLIACGALKPKIKNKFNYLFNKNNDIIGVDFKPLIVGNDIAERLNFFKNYLIMT